MNNSHIVRGESAAHAQFGSLTNSVPTIGPLIPADESLTHQIVNTFGAINESDRSWTEKVWCATGRRDGSLSIDFGLGKYHNRNVMDGFAGVSRGREQWAVRASRELWPDLDCPVVGPINYVVVEPLNVVRFILEPNSAANISFEINFHGLIRPFFEERHHYLEKYRVGSDVIRYHQSGRVDGWVEIDGVRESVDDWIAVRDHSWGIRRNVGEKPTDIQPGVSVLHEQRGQSSSLHWSPWLMRRPDGSLFEVMQYRIDDPIAPYFSGSVNHEDGRQDRIVRSTLLDAAFDPGSRRLRTSVFEMQLESGEVLKAHAEALGDSGFYLAAGGYGKWKNSGHGLWKGKSFLDGEYVEDCFATPELGQVRDRPTRVVIGDAEGFGIHESFFLGDWPQFDLGPDTDLSAT